MARLDDRPLREDFQRALKLMLSDGGIAAFWIAKKYGVSRPTLMAAAAGGKLRRDVVERLEAAFAAGCL